LPLTFGLGMPSKGKTVRLQIVWPSGHKATIQNIEPNQFITVEEGKGIVQNEPLKFSRAISQNQHK
jgi:enediyne biosynthesis protein E4